MAKNTRGQTKGISEGKIKHGGTKPATITQRPQVAPQGKSGAVTQGKTGKK